MTAAALIRKNLAYEPDTGSLFSRIRGLGNGVLLDSGDGYADHIDVCSAAPIAEEILDHRSGRKQLLQSVATMEDRLKLNAVVTNHSHPLPGWMGIASYDLGKITEQVELKPDGNLPLWHFGFYPSILVTDHKAKTTQLIGLSAHQDHLQALNDALALPNETPGCFKTTEQFTPSWSYQQYEHQFQKVIEYIHGGDCYQANLAQHFQAEYEGCPWSAYRQLRASVSAPMGCYLEAADWSLLSVSPERFIQHKNGQLETKPIKGTRPKLPSEKENVRQIRELETSNKDRAENLMIVDLLRNDLGRSCVTGSVEVHALFQIETFSNVHHLVSTVTGKLRPDISPMQALLNAFPGGSITGAPKHRAMEIIAELEACPRSFYCGSVIYWDVGGKMDSNILIRSLVAQNQKLHCWAGGGIVADSTAQQEHQETLDKVGNILKTLS